MAQTASGDGTSISCDFKTLLIYVCVHHKMAFALLTNLCSHFCVSFCHFVSRTHTVMYIYTQQCCMYCVLLDGYMSVYDCYMVYIYIYTHIYMYIYTKIKNFLPKNDGDVWMKKAQKQDIQNGRNSIPIPTFHKP